MRVQPRTGFHVIPGVPSSLWVHSMVVLAIVISYWVAIIRGTESPRTGGSMGTHVGVWKVAAKRLGLSVEEYTAKLEAGFKWCMRCRFWKPLGEFGVDNSRGDR